MSGNLTILSPLEIFSKWEKEKADSIYMRQPIDGVWKNYTWKQCGEEVRRMAAYLNSLKLEPGSRIAILSKNCVHWILSDLAIWMAGHVSVPIYPNITNVTLNQILVHSESKLVFVGKLDDWKHLKPGIPNDIKCIAYPFYGITEYPNWNDIIKNVEPYTGREKRSIEDLATIMYTSGTTGTPKGVMLSHHNVLSNVMACTPYLPVSRGDKVISFLPLNHIFERMVTYVYLFSGCSIYYAESLDTLGDNLKEVKPSMFTTVPRLLEKVYEKIMKKAEALSGVKKKLFFWALRLAGQYDIRKS
ncbi:MAG TPA: AMP-binding protein, partial [Chitinophagales bacterium]|nr:AMP-binding protein [Chitinophagales bacterium]